MVSFSLFQLHTMQCFETSAFRIEEGGEASVEVTLTPKGHFTLSNKANEILSEQWDFCGFLKDFS